MAVYFNGEGTLDGQRMQQLALMDSTLCVSTSCHLQVIDFPNPNWR
jgi:hypothetical protein